MVSSSGTTPGLPRSRLPPLGRLPVDVLPCLRRPRPRSLGLRRRAPPGVGRLGSPSTPPPSAAADPWASAG
eukprot:11640126-Alexandrium_andersonii.AAC.1